MSFSISALGGRHNLVGSKLSLSTLARHARSRLPSPPPPHAQRKIPHTFIKKGKEG